MRPGRRNGGRLLADGSRRSLRPAEFEALSLLDRVQWLSQGRFKFLKDGAKVPSYQALKPEK